MPNQRANEIHTRQPVPPTTKDIENHPVQFMTAGLLKLEKQFGNLARIIENRAYVVDEYVTKSLTPDAETQLTVIPQYEQMTERIESVIINGPPSTVTVKLGDRVWTITISATGIVVMSNIGLLLSRTDDRILYVGTPSTPGTAGDYSMELMGFADARY